jgi:SAM-dependent methyltransferase
MIKAIAHELKFWKEFVKTPRFLNGWVRNIKTPELHEPVVPYVKGKVLDLGSGVVSILNGTVKDLVPCDPLGELYECVFDYKKYNLPVPLPIAGEDIEFKNEFDVVHISNALDHSQDPNKVFKNMLRATKDLIIIQGFENEALFENWQGFHQWNMTLEGQTLKISGKEKVNLNSDDYKLEVILSQLIPLDNKNWIIFIAKK